MRRSIVPIVCCLCAAPPSAGGVLAQAAPAEAGEEAHAVAASAGLAEWVAALDAALLDVADLAAAGDVGGATGLVVRAYLDHMEPLEGYYGRGAVHGVPGLAERVTALEAEFHGLMQERDGAAMAGRAEALRASLAGLPGAARAAGVPLRPAGVVARVLDDRTASGSARTPEIAAIVEEVDAARRLYDAGDAAGALAGIEHAYLERFEVLEPLVPGTHVRRIESLIHLQLRPQLTRGAEPEVVRGGFNALRAELLLVDESLAAGTPFWFAAVNSFAIIVREGLEAVLLVGALLAYLGAIGAERKHRRQIYVGVAAGLAASVGTWVLARTLLPVTGASRELLEGVTALVAVGVLLYVSHWLFQKAYIHDWKQYLRERVGAAATGGSVLAMAGLAFAAVYREGFETVLFYQALLYDAPRGSVLAGFVPGTVLILGIGFAIIRLGLRLTQKKVFAFTNAILIYLAFVFLGKGLYNLQEGGVFAPLPLEWIPESAALQQVFGLYPVAQTVLAQLALAAALGATWVIYRLRTAPVIPAR